MNKSQNTPYGKSQKGMVRNAALKELEALASTDHDAYMVRLRQIKQQATLDAKSLANVLSESGNDAFMLALKAHIDNVGMTTWESVAFSDMVRNEYRLIQAEIIANIYEHKGGSAGIEAKAAFYSKTNMNTSERFKFSDMLEIARNRVRTASIESTSPTPC